MAGMSAVKTMNKKTKEQINKQNKTTFWLFNIANTICAVYIIIEAYVHLCDNAPVSAFNIAVIAMFQFMFGLMLNVLFHKAAKDKEIYLDG